MFLFENLLYEDPNAEDDNKNQTMLELVIENIDPWGLLYSVIISIFQNFYAKVATILVGKYNYQFKKDYNDALSSQLFVFNFLNTFIPVGFNAFYKKKFLATFSVL